MDFDFIWFDFHVFFCSKWLNGQDRLSYKEEDIFRNVVKGLILKIENESRSCKKRKKEERGKGGKDQKR